MSVICNYLVTQKFKDTDFQRIYLVCFPHNELMRGCVKETYNTKLHICRETNIVRSISVYHGSVLAGAFLVFNLSDGSVT